MNDILKMTIDLKGKIRLSNTLISGKYNFSVMEMRVLVMLLSRVWFDNEIRTYEISVEQIAQLFSLKPQNVYKYLAKESATKKNVLFYIDELKEKDNSPSLWFSIFQYSRGKLTVRLSDDLKPYILQLRRDYTEFDLKELILMDNVRAFRLYLVLISNFNKNNGCKRNPCIEYSISELKDMLSFYPEKFKFAEFRRCVLLPALKCINTRTQFMIFIKKHMSGKNVEKIEFDVWPSNTEETRIIFQEWEIETIDDYHSVVDIYIPSNC